MKELVGNHALKKLNRVSAVIKFYELLLKNGNISENGGAMRRLKKLKTDYALGRRYMSERSEYTMNVDHIDIYKKTYSLN